MYQAHFGLERGLFGEGVADDAAVFRSPMHDQLIANFKLAFGSASSAVVLRGPAGVGKTTLTSAALRASSTRLALAWLNGMPTNSAELLELILVELGVSTLRTTRIERLQLWRQFQGEMRATDSRLFVVAERTEDLSPEVLHALDQLTAPDAAGNPGANLVLLGHAGIEDHLAIPLLDSLRQRIRLRAELEPFTEAGLQDYLRHQLACAGGHFDHVFAPGAVAALYRYSHGVARLANTLCETALDVAAREREKLLTAELVARTAVSLLRLGETAPAAPSATPAASAASAPAAQARRTQPPVATPAPPPEPRAPLASATPAPMAAAPPKSTPTPSVATRTRDEFEYDGGATDVSDVAFIDFPVLTDAVELPPPAPAAKPAAAAPEKATPPGPPAMTPAIVKPAAKPVGGAEATYAALKPAPKPTPAPAPAPAPSSTAATKPTAPAAPTTSRPTAGPEGDDVARGTETTPASADARTIEDISSSMAETLFGDAELDLVTAALASAAEWPDEDLQPATKPTPTTRPTTPPPAKPERPKAALPVDDSFDLFGLLDDAPLELIDDSAQPPTDRTKKTAAR